MKPLLIAALFTCMAVSGAESTAVEPHILLASAAASNKTLLNHLMDATRKKVVDGFPGTNLVDYKVTAIVFQDRPVVQITYFKSAKDGFLFEYRIENGKAKLVNETSGSVADPEAAGPQAAATPVPIKKDIK